MMNYEKRKIGMLRKILDALSGGQSKLSKFAGRSILVADDGEVERRTAQRILEQQGFKVTCAMDGESAFSMIEQGAFDLLLLDCMMPNLSGPELCKRLKMSERTKNIPVIFLSGSDTPSNIIDCYDLGAEQFLAKPVNAKLLIKQIEGIFKEHV